MGIAKEEAKIPEREAVVRLLDEIPKKFASVKEHSRLCELAAEEIALQLKDRGIKINPKFVSMAALAHDVFKHLGENGNECIKAKDYFAEKGFPEFAEALITNVLQGPVFKDHVKLDELGLEQRIVIYCDDICRGIPIRDKKEQILGWRNDIFPLDEAWKSIEDRVKRGEFKREGNIKQEFELVRIIEKELVEKGLDTGKLIREVRKKFRYNNGL